MDVLIDSFKFLDRNELEKSQLVSKNWLAIINSKKELLPLRRIPLIENNWIAFVGRERRSDLVLRYKSNNGDRIRQMPERLWDYGLENVVIEDFKILPFENTFYEKMEKRAKAFGRPIQAIATTFGINESNADELYDCYEIIENIFTKLIRTAKLNIVFDRWNHNSKEHLKTFYHFLRNPVLLNRLDSIEKVQVSCCYQQIPLQGQAQVKERIVEFLCGDTFERRLGNVGVYLYVCPLAIIKMVVKAFMEKEDVSRFVRAIQIGNIDRYGDHIKGTDSFLTGLSIPVKYTKRHERLFGSQVNLIVYTIKRRDGWAMDVEICKGMLKMIISEKI